MKLIEPCLSCSAADGETCNDCSLVRPRPLLVRQGRYALHFHTNICGPVFAPVADEQATLFGSPGAARARAFKHGLAPGQFTLETV